MAKLPIWIAVAPLALLVFLLILRNLTEVPFRLPKESVDAAVAVGRSAHTLTEPSLLLRCRPWRAYNRLKSPSRSSPTGKYHWAAGWAFTITSGLPKAAHSR